MSSLYIRFILAPLCLVLIAGSLAAGQPKREDQELSDELYELIGKRTDLITQSIENSRNEWVGTYAAGDHHPTIFMWTPEEGFLVTSSLHTFAASWVNYGEVATSGSLLSLRPTLPKENQYAHQIDTEFRLVKWGEQHFLIPLNKLRPFAYAVHSQAESQIVDYLVRWDDHDKSRRGLPDLPGEFTKYLKMDPIVTRITAVGPEKATGQEVTIAAGRRDNLIEGMIFYFSPTKGADFSIRISEVSDTSAKGHIWSSGSTGSAQNIRIRPGLKLTSRIPKGFIEPG